MSYYFINNKKPSKVAHIFDTEAYLTRDHEDTMCKMWSSGGIRNKDVYDITDKLDGRKICKTCLEPPKKKQKKKKHRKKN